MNIYIYINTYIEYVKHFDQMGTLGVLPRCQSSMMELHIGDIPMKAGAYAHLMKLTSSMAWEEYHVEVL